MPTSQTYCLAVNQYITWKKAQINIWSTPVVVTAEEAYTLNELKTPRTRTNFRKQLPDHDFSITGRTTFSTINILVSFVIHLSQLFESQLRCLFNKVFTQKMKALINHS